MSEVSGSVAPDDACDCHTHVFDPRVVPATASAYPLPVAPFEAHRAMLDAAGIRRAVVVQPSAYGPDHTVLTRAMARSDGRLRGVGLLGRAAKVADFDRLDQHGIGALRFVETRVPGTNERYPGNFGLDDFRALRAPIAARGWHAEFWAPLAQAADICDAEAGRGVPIVLDHLAGVTAATAPDDPDFRRIVRHVERGDVWIKLVLCRTARTLEEALATAPLHAVLFAANPERLVWGTDYPFIRKGADAPDPARLLAIIIEWAGRHANAVLNRNPAVLYRFH